MSLLTPSVASSSGCSSFTINSFTQNLASVLSDTKRSKAEVAAFFTRHWGEQFVPQKTLSSAPTIPKISLEHFRHYLDNTAKKHRQYLRVRKTLQRGNGHFIGEQIASDEIPTIFFSSAFSYRDLATFEAIFLDPRQGESDKLISGAEQRRAAAGVGPQCSLYRPASCGSLSSMQSVQMSTMPAAEACHGRMFRGCHRLQMRLEHFDDTVGILLNQQLEAKNEHFWKIINSYGALKADLEMAIERTLVARERLAKSKRELCERSEKILSLHQAKTNRQRMLARLNEIACLRDAQTTVQILLSQGDIPRALECIDMAKEVLANDLLGVNCFRHLDSQLDELIVAIGKVLREEFLSIIQKEFAWPIDERKIEDRKQREEEMRQVISSLLRCGEFRFILVLRGEIEEGVKNTTRQVVKNRLLEYVHSNSAVGVGLGPSSFAEQIGLLSDEQWEHTLLAVLHSLTIFCHSVLSIQSLVALGAAQFDVDVSIVSSKKALPRVRSATEVLNPTKGRRRCDSFCTSTSAPPQNGQTEETNWATESEPKEGENTDQRGETDGPKAADDGKDRQQNAQSDRTRTKCQTLGDLLAMPCRDIAQLRVAAPLLISHAIYISEERVAKLISARYKDTMLEHCRPNHFHKICQLATGAVESWYKVADDGKGGLFPAAGNGTHRSPVFATIRQQTAKFISKFSEAKRRQFNQRIDTEPWQPSRIPYVFQRIVDNFRLSGALSDVDDNSEDEQDEDDDEREGNLDYLVLSGGKRFIVVGSATSLLRALAQYSDLLLLFPHCSMELTMDVVQILKAFNSRTCQLILGAGARQLVGLKMISVKHLALALRSLQFIAQFIPTLRQSFLNQLPPDRHTLLRYFDQTQRDFEDHQGEIKSKMLALMDRELIGALEEWKLEGKVPTAAFQQIVMQIGKFYSSYSAVMPAELTTEILLRIHENFKLYLRQHLNSRGISPHDSIAYGMAGQDFAYYMENVRALPDCKSFPVDTIGDVIQHKPSA